MANPFVSRGNTTYCGLHGSSATFSLSERVKHTEGSEYQSTQPRRKRCTSQEAKYIAVESHLECSLDTVGRRGMVLVASCRCVHALGRRERRLQLDTTEPSFPVQDFRRIHQHQLRRSNHQHRTSEERLTTHLQRKSFQRFRSSITLEQSI